MRRKSNIYNTNVYNVTPIAVGPEDKIMVSLPEFSTVESISRFREALDDAGLKDRVICVVGVDLAVLHGAVAPTPSRSVQ